MTVFIVTGPPCAGKTTWVQANADPADVIVDMDALVAAMTNSDASHTAPSSLIWRTAMAARDAAVRKVLDRQSRHVVENINGIETELDAYVIHAVPNRDQVDRYIAQGARILVVDPGRRTVINRATEAGRIDTVHNAIVGWYHDHAGYVADRGCHVA
ncbi:AAA family ATPase [Mycolicibacterium nivoides]|uniref:AAA family ATPase n=1 Tax=Mycolicibacterium nivoides TaxID=2487344 RepID=A0ABW9L6M7_9MYCO